MTDVKAAAPVVGCSPGTPSGIATIEFGMNAQAAVEAPRFQTRHLVSSFDNHAMNPGDLLLDERIAPGQSVEKRRRARI